MSTPKIEKSVSQVQSSVSKVTEISKPKASEGKVAPFGISQRESVYQEVIRVLKEDKVTFDGMAPAKAQMTEERLAKVYESLAQGFKAGKIQLKQTPSNQKKLAEAGLLKTYIIGLVNNWLRRDNRLNGTPATKKA